jgi:hypothetical protein
VTPPEDLSATTGRSRPPIPHDRLFKELLGAFLYEFLELFLPDLANLVDPESIHLTDKELFPRGERTRQADLVAQARLRVPTEKAKTASFLIHLEHEAQSKKPLQFPRRMLQYTLHLYDQTGQAVYPIALLSYPKPWRKRPAELRIACAGLTTLRFQYRVIQLNGLLWRNFARQPHPVSAALMSRMRIEASERHLVRLQCLRMLAQLGLDAEKEELISQFFDAYLRLDPEEEKKFAQEFGTIPSEEQEAMLKITTSWEEKGQERERQRTEQERQRAEQARQRAEQERQRAVLAEERAQQEHERAERLASRLRELGIDPEDL